MQPNVMKKKTIACAKKTYKISKKALPLCCPMDNMTLWNAHPKVYLSLDDKGAAVCPYCGTKYILPND